MKLKSRIRFRIAWKVFMSIAVAVLFCVIYLYYSSLLKNAAKGIYAIPAFAVVYIVFLFKSGSIKLLWDKDWIGEVLSVRTIMAYEPITYAIAISRGTPKIIPYTIIEVRKENGKHIKLKIQSRKMSPSVFKVGGKIKHYRTTKYPVLLDYPDPDLHFCPLCGRTLNNPYCPDCKVKL